MELSEITPLLRSIDSDLLSKNNALLGGEASKKTPLEVSTSCVGTTSYSPLEKERKTFPGYEGVSDPSLQSEETNKINSIGVGFGKKVEATPPVHPVGRLQLQQVVDYLQASEAEGRGDHNISSRWFSYLSSEQIHPYEPTYWGQFKQVFLGGSQASLLTRFITLLNHHFGEVYTQHNILNPTQKNVAT
jgi:hypothetical protein